MKMSVVDIHNHSKPYPTFHFESQSTFIHHYSNSTKSTLMKNTIKFIFVWLCVWMLFTTMAWFVNPGSDFRVMAGSDVVGIFTILLGWIPAVINITD